MLNRGCGQEAINGRDNHAFSLGSRREFAPEPTGLDINGENPIAIFRFESIEPGEKRLFLSPRGQESDAFGDLAHGERAQE